MKPSASWFRMDQTQTGESPRSARSVAERCVFQQSHQPRVGQSMRPGWMAVAPHREMNGNPNLAGSCCIQFREPGGVGRIDSSSPDAAARATTSVRARRAGARPSCGCARISASCSSGWPVHRGPHRRQQLLARGERPRFGGAVGNPRRMLENARERRHELRLRQWFSAASVIIVEAGMGGSRSSAGRCRSAGRPRPGRGGTM